MHSRRQLLANAVIAASRVGSYDSFDLAPKPAQHFIRDRRKTEEASMPDLGLNSEHVVVIQNGSQVDYLNFSGNTLTGSFLANYPGLTGWDIVASGFYNGDAFPDLVFQNATTGQLDFVFLNANAGMIGTLLGPIVPPVQGEGLFPGAAVGQMGPTLVSQLPDGSIDLLAVNAAGALIRSDLIPGTAGLPGIVGVAESSTAILSAQFPIIQGINSGADDSIVVQYPNGLLDVLGFTGNFAAAGVVFSGSFALPGTAGSPPVFAIDQDFNFGSSNVNHAATVNGVFGEVVSMVGQLANGQIDSLFFDSGYFPADHGATRGVEFATLAENTFVPAGWHIVDAGIVAHTDLFPIT
jgi:hypothetical protein